MTETESWVEKKTTHFEGQIFLSEINTNRLR